MIKLNAYGFIRVQNKTIKYLPFKTNEELELIIEQNHIIICKKGLTKTKTVDPDKTMDSSNKTIRIQCSCGDVFTREIDALEHLRVQADEIQVPTLGISKIARKKMLDKFHRLNYIYLRNIIIPKVK